MNICPACQNGNEDGARTCASCGYGFDSTLGRDETVFAKQMPVTDFEISAMIDGRYLVMKELGRGGMGVVYLVKDTRVRDREIALKMVHPNLVQHDEARKRFEDEVAISLDLHHKNIIRVYHLETGEDLLYFTMEYVEGRSLREEIGERQKAKNPFTLAEVLAVAVPLLEGLSHAHQHTIHRDIKPENIIINGRFPNIGLKILDFGIAKTMSVSRFRKTAQSLGTAYYMAPEQMSGAGDIDKRADLYSVGMILYEMLTLEMAVGRFSLPSEVIPTLPSALDGFIEKSLASKREKRYSSAEEMKAGLEGIERAEEAEQQRKEEDRRLQEYERREAERKRQAEEEKCRREEAEERREEEARKQKAEEEKRRRDDLFTSGSNWTDPVTGMEFVFVKGGCYLMGDTFGDGDTDEKPVHEVCVDDFWIGKYPVTQRQWLSMMGNNPSNFKKGDNYPVEYVSYDDTQDFLKKLNSKTSKNYRLPTEAEWEYAARSGGKKERWAGTSSESELGDYAWYNDNSGDSTNPVGQKMPNGLGVYDMSGNVLEWCSDRYGNQYYVSSPNANPQGPTFGANRVFRGGSWYGEPRNVRVANRGGESRRYRFVNLGFRLVLPVQ